MRVLSFWLICVLGFSSVVADTTSSKNAQSPNKSDIISELVALKKKQANLSIMQFTEKLQIYKRELLLQSKLTPNDSINLNPSKKEILVFLLQSMPIIVWQLLFLLLWAYLLYLCFFVTTNITRKKYIIIVILLILASYLLIFSIRTSQPRAFVVCEQTLLHSGPGDEYPVIGSNLHIGMVVRRLEVKNNFVKVEVKVEFGSDRGWVSAATIENI